jgi:hypothetical protein
MANDNANNPLWFFAWDDDNDNDEDAQENTILRRILPKESPIDIAFKKHNQAIHDSYVMRTQRAAEERKAAQLKKKAEKNK